MVVRCRNGGRPNDTDCVSLILPVVEGRREMESGSTVVDLDLWPYSRSPMSSCSLLFHSGTEYSTVSTMDFVLSKNEMRQPKRDCPSIPAVIPLPTETQCSIIASVPILLPLALLHCGMLEEFINMTAQDQASSILQTRCQLQATQVQGRRRHSTRSFHSLCCGDHRRP